MENINKNNIPIHIAIIMDGNGRWAKMRGLPRHEGHKQGLKTLRKLLWLLTGTQRLRHLTYLIN